MPRFVHFVSILLFSQSLNAEIDFSREIRPLLNKHCTACHGGVKEAGEVSFSSRDRAGGKGESGTPVSVPGNPDASDLSNSIES
ncbi:MAG: c-type cytochrome domain-containing protein, partial [Akkermansiaceae bacterium]